MIYNENKIYATVWKVTPAENGKYIDLQITTSEKDQEGNYKNSGWFPRCIGHSVNSLKGLKKATELSLQNRNLQTKDIKTRTTKLGQLLDFLFWKLRLLMVILNPTSLPQ